MLANTLEMCFFKKVRSVYGFSFFKKFYKTDFAVETAIHKIKNCNLLLLHDFPNFLIQDKMVHLSRICCSVEECSLVSYAKTKAIDKKTLVVVFTSNLEQPELLNLDSFCRNNHISWLLVHSESETMTCGPFFKNQKPDHCYSCFLERLKSNSGATQLPVMIDGNAEINPVLLSWIELQLILLISEVSVVNLTRSRIIFNPSRSLLEKINYLPAPLCSVCG